MAAAPEAQNYCRDGDYSGYLDVTFPGNLIFNIRKNDIFTAEDVNAGLRHYIPTLARQGLSQKAGKSSGRSYCFRSRLYPLWRTEKPLPFPPSWGCRPFSLFNFF